MGHSRRGRTYGLCAGKNVFPQPTASRSAGRAQRTGMEKDRRRPAGCILYSCRCIHFLGSRLHPANYPACARSDSGYRHIAYKRRRFLPQPAHRSAKRQRYDDGIPYHHRQPGTPWGRLSEQTGRSLQ